MSSIKGNGHTCMTYRNIVRQNICVRGLLQSGLLISYIWSLIQIVQAAMNLHSSVSHFDDSKLPMWIFRLNMIILLIYIQFRGCRCFLISTKNSKLVYDLVISHLWGIQAAYKSHAPHPPGMALKKINLVFTLFFLYSLKSSQIHLSSYHVLFKHLSLRRSITMMD